MNGTIWNNKKEVDKMNKTELCIHIVPSNVNLNSLLGFNTKKDGYVQSTAKDIKVNKASYGYSVIFNDAEFMKLDNPKFVAKIVQLLTKNLPNSVIHVSIEYNYQELIEYHFDDNVSDKVLNLDDLFEMQLKGLANFEYERSDNFTSMIDDKIDMNEFVNVPYMDDDYDDDDEEEDDDYINDPLGMLFTKDWNEKPTKSKPTQKKYGKSSVVLNAENAKRCYNRHGVVVASKKDIMRDRKILKKFLKEFIPGDAAWKQEFRSDILKRWMSMYCISKSDLKYLQKKRKKQYYRDNRTRKVTNAMNVTRNILSVPVSDWYNPNK